MAATRDFEIVQGKTFSHVMRWEALPVVYKAISAITNTAPVRITAVGHNLLAGWRAAVVSVKGMTQINAQNNPPKAVDYHRTTVVDDDTIEFNDVNAADFKQYQSGGYVQYNTPVDLAGCTGRLVVKDKVGGTVLAELTTANGGVLIDNTAKTITLTFTALQTAGFGWKKGVYELEIINGATVTGLLAGTIMVSKEIAS